MISFDAVLLCTLADAPTGAFFQPAGPEETPFLVGVIGGNTPVAVELDETFNFAKAADWSRPRGFVVNGARIVVDPSSAVAVEGRHDVPLGSMIAMGDSIAILAQGSRMRQAVRLGRDATRGAEYGDIAFTRWQVILGQGSAVHVLHEHEAGPDPSTMVA